MTPEIHTDPNSIEQKVERSREPVRQAIEYIAKAEPTVKRGQSPIDVLLQPYADTIRKALAKGHSAAWIATEIKKRGSDFDVESIRQRISKTFGPRARKTAGSSSADRRSTPQRRPSTGVAKAVVHQPAAHAALEEEAR
jgi:hypothetical protein